jgi:hypothetical protein
MFEINTYLLNKLGWVNYSPSRGIGLGPKVFTDDPLVRYFILLNEKNICYLVKELSDDEKQKSKNTYKFIKFDYSDMNSPNFKITELNSNKELFSLVIENEAMTNKAYIRNFKLNKILR